jgi:hypothetical protein
MTSVETLGYYRAFLRDEQEILTVLDEPSPPPMFPFGPPLFPAGRLPRRDAQIPPPYLSPPQGQNENGCKKSEPFGALTVSMDEPGRETGKELGNL